MKYQCKIFETAEWPGSAAGLIQHAIETCLRQKGKTSVMLTGGRSAERLYRAWAGLPAFRQLTNVKFFFGDERCVAADHPESNYGLALRTLFLGGIPEGCSVFRMEAEDPDHQAAALRYDALLPDNVDIVIFSVGEDGHVASLFPGSAALREANRRVVPVIAPKPPQCRLTVTPRVVAQASSIFVLAIGTEKAAVLKKALVAPVEFDSLPARLVLNATWLLSAASANEFL